MPQHKLVILCNKKKFNLFLHRSCGCLAEPFATPRTLSLDRLTNQPPQNNKSPTAQAKRLTLNGSLCWGHLQLWQNALSEQCRPLTTGMPGHAEVVGKGLPRLPGKQNGRRALFVLGLAFPLSPSQIISNNYIYIYIQFNSN